VGVDFILHTQEVVTPNIPVESICKFVLNPAIKTS